MLHVHSSNRLELLLNAMMKAASGDNDPLTPATIVVQNAGMARWVSQQIAIKQGISANLQFETPGSYFWSVCRAWLTDLPEHPYRKDALVWKIFSALPELLPQSEFVELSQYLVGDSSAHKRLQLSQQIANAFDRYLIYRPDVINSWESGAELHWQAQLWRQVSPGVLQHWGAIKAHLQNLYEQAPKAPLAQQISVFGISDMPPLYTQILTAVAMHTSIDLYYLNPCEHYWADIVDAQLQSRRRAVARKAGLDDPTGLLDIGNPLLASWGHAGQAFLDQLLELNVEESEDFYRPQSVNRLCELQSHILDLRNDKPALAPYTDTSIQVHSTHTRLREVQILHDQLLRMFETQPDLRPGDIIVMAPDIDRYAPFIDATFSLPQDETWIPWSISDRRFRAEQQLLERVGWFLSLPTSRFESTELLSLLDLPAVRRKFSVDSGGVQSIERWVRESGIRWSLDAAMRESFALPASDLNSWRFGLRRLFLGFALPDLDGGLYENTAPYPHIEGAQSAQLEVLAQLVDLCAKWRGVLTADHSVTRWLEILDQLIADFFEPDDTESQILQTAHSKFYELTRETGAETELTLSREVVAELFHQVLEDDSSERHFLTGSVTFSNMVPMRSIPAQVVCILGMNAEDFPRADNVRSFDLIAAQPRRGDRRRRNDDRYLFLEALLSARNIFYISYLGRDQRDNSEKAVSTVVAELIDYANLTITEHPLQPFSPRYFDSSDTQLFSYKQQWYDAACVKPQLVAPAFFDAQAAKFQAPSTTVSLMELVKYFTAPAESLLQHCLEVRASFKDDDLLTSESFTVAGLQRWKLKQLAYAMHNQGDSKKTIKQKLLAYGELPVGPIGDRELAAIHSGSVAIDGRVLKYKTEEFDSEDFNLTLGQFQLYGRLSDIRSGGLFMWRFGKLRSKDLLLGWIKHLVLCMLQPKDVAIRSVLVFEDWTAEFKKVDNPDALLTELLVLRAEGLISPQPWFPKSALSKQLDESDLKCRPKGNWKGVSVGVAPDELAEPGFATVWRGLEPFDLKFDQLASQVMGSVLRHIEFVSAETDVA